MKATTLRHVLTAIAMLIAIPPAIAGDLSKEECLDAHSRGQDAKEQGKLSFARKLFLTCAQSSCPSLVQGDCARFADDLARLQPSVSFIARDGMAADLPDTSVYVDDVLLVTRLDDGTLHDIDPGKHVIRFTNNGHEQIETIVIGSGEKGRTVLARFAAPTVAAPPPAPAVVTRPPSAAPRPPAPSIVHPTGPRVLMVVGAALAVGGGALGVIGLTRIPSGCSISTHQCAAPPGDPSFDVAKSAVGLSDIGWSIGALGVAAFAGGAIWYFTGPTKTKERMVLAPWVAPGSGGFALSGSL